MTRPEPHVRATPPRRAGARSGVVGLVVIGLAAVLAVSTASGAQAAAYRYWAYWWGAADGWAYADAGAATHVPADGAVEGWRFAVSGDGASASRPPRAAADFAALCGATAPVAGRKRVGVVLDYGTAADAPDGEKPPVARGACAVVAPDATGAAVLAAVAGYRVDAGLVCGIDGYPARECARVVAGPTTATPSTRSTPATAPPASTTAPSTTRSTPPTPTATTAATTTAPATSGPPASAPASSSGAAAPTSPQPTKTTTSDTSLGRDTGESPVALATTAPTPAGGGAPVGLLVGVVVVGGVAAAGAWLARRDR